MEILEAFAWNGIYAVRTEDGWHLTEEALLSEPIELQDIEVVKRFCNEDGRCYAGDDQFNYAVEQTWRMLRQTE